MESRRNFLQKLSLASFGALLGGSSNLFATDKHLQIDNIDSYDALSTSRKVKVGLVGYGFSKFSADFGFQNHPNVEIVAVSDIIPERCQALANHVKCSKKYASLEELVKDKDIEAVFIATDAPSHGRHAILALNHGKHVAVAVPAIFSDLEEAHQLQQAVERSGKLYMMFETSCYREDLYAMRQIYRAGGFGKILYSEGEYLHYKPNGLPSYNNWRDGIPPMYYITHATAYHLAVTEGYFTEVSCYGIESTLDVLKNGDNVYNNKFGTEVAIFKSNDGGLSRMMYSNDTNGPFAEEGRVRGEKGSYSRSKKYHGEMKDLPNVSRPQLPEGVPAGGHGGSHGQLTHDFITCILNHTKPWIDVRLSLNLSVPGIVAHESALHNGKTLSIPHF
ncbi:Gfo/Idh/MocA family protein [Sphingobacterium composti Ten et al. 2007 non Yoo et al. 2007]|uniref:Gfo/Idh/MocA family protein n=1 Tax=Sphingobacterium composti TaxID=363260 RepID=UPI0013592BD7|nr:Gfo/Idh/MocA family oxidoreductase [Sphingobacterium composti Ten et al. 2007 non Yoo et al. 2007]